MRIVYHLGAHCTDEDRLLRCLTQNRPALAAQGIVVPDPARYRTLLRDTAVSLKGGSASPETQQQVLAQILQQDRAERLILSWDSFLSYPQWVLRGTLYPAAAERIRGFTRIFPGIEAEFHLAMRNPATFLPALFQKQRGKSLAEFLEGCDVTTLRWSDVITSIRALNPDVPLTVWCDEDTPLIWPEVVAAVAGHSADLLESSDGLLATILSPEGLGRMQAYLATHPPATVAQRRRIVSAFLAKFARPDRIGIDVEMPGWTAELAATMTALYEADTVRIARIPGVTLIAP